MNQTLLPLALALAIPCTAPAAVIIGNLSAFTNDGGQSGNGSVITGGTFSSGKAIGFTMPSTAYFLDSVTLRLDNLVGTTDAPTVSIWTSNGSNPVTQVAVLNNPGAFFGDVNTNYVFTPATSLTLQSATSYFIVVQQLNPAASGDTAFNWLNGNPTVAPTGIASSAIARFGPVANNNPASFTSTSGQFNWFQVEGTAIPEPSSFAALAGFAALSLVASRRRRRV